MRLRFPVFRTVRTGRPVTVAVLALLAVLVAGPATAQGESGLDKATQALFDAVLVNDLEAVKASVNADADLEARDRWGMTPIDLAVDRGHFKVAHFLLSVRNFRRERDADREATAEAPTPPAPAPQRPIGSTVGGTVGGTTGGTLGGTLGSAAPAPRTPIRPPAPAATEPRGGAAREIAPPEAEPSAEATPAPQWPADQPNPFDPQVAAPGSSLPLVGPVERPKAKPGRPSVRVRPPAPAAVPRQAATSTIVPPRSAAPRRAPPNAEMAGRPAPRANVPVTESVPEPAKPAAGAKDTAAAATDDGDSGPGFFGRVLGAIGLGDGDETAEAPQAESKAEERVTPETSVAAAPTPPPEPRVTVQSTPILADAPEAEPAARAEPPAAAPVRQTRPRVMMRRAQVVPPEPSTPPSVSRPPVAADPPPPAPTAAAAVPKEAVPADAKTAATAPPAEEPGLFGRIGNLFLGEDAPATETEGEPGFLGRIASIIPGRGDDTAADGEPAATTAQPGPEVAAAPAAGAPGENAAEAAPAAETDAEEDEPGFFGRALDYVGLGDDEAEIEARKAARAAAAAAPKAPPPGKPGRQVARIRPVTPPVMARVQARDPLRGVVLTLGETTGLGGAAPVSEANERRPRGCVTKRRDTMLFCVRPVDWPVEMEPHFRVATVMYQGPKVVVRYADGAASRYHAIFPSESFDAVASYFCRRFGEPTDEFRRGVRPFASKALANPALMWQSIVATADGERTAILEVRRYDDVRGGFPDTKHGVVMLYWTDTPPIFPQLSSMDLMMIQWSRTR